MATRTHQYTTTVSWTGNRGDGTASYRAYGRDHTIRAANRPDLLGSSDPVFRGDADRYSPEDLLVASVSACHMLWYLHLCADAGIVVTEYIDEPIGTLIEEADGRGAFSEVVLCPRVTVTDAATIERAIALHEDAHRMCFVAQSVRFPIRHQPLILAVENAASHAL